MSGAVKAAQAALLASLKAHPTLSTLVSGIYDGAPPRAAFPYVVVSMDVESVQCSFAIHEIVSILPSIKKIRRSCSVCSVPGGTCA